MSGCLLRLRLHDEVAGIVRPRSSLSKAVWNACPWWVTDTRLYLSHDEMKSYAQFMKFLHTIFIFFHGHCVLKGKRPCFLWHSFAT